MSCVRWGSEAGTGLVTFKELLWPGVMTGGDCRLSLWRTLRTEIPHGKGEEITKIETVRQVFDPLQF